MQGITRFRFDSKVDYYTELVEKLTSTSMILDLRSDNVDMARTMHNIGPLSEPTLGCVINHFKWSKFFWILPQRRTLSPWLAFASPPFYRIPILMVLLSLTCWMVAKADLDRHYQSLTYTMFTIMRVAISDAPQSIPNSRKLRTFMLFILLVFIPLNVSILSVWTATLTQPVREPKITNLEMLANSDIPMKFGYSLTDLLTSRLTKKSAEMMRDKWIDTFVGNTNDDLLGKTETSLFVINKLLTQIKNVEDVEKFEHVRYSLEIVELGFRLLIVGSSSFIYRVLSNENWTSPTRKLEKNDFPGRRSRVV